MVAPITGPIDGCSIRRVTCNEFPLKQPMRNGTFGGRVADKEVDHFLGDFLMRIRVRRSPSTPRRDVATQALRTTLFIPSWLRFWVVL